MLSNARAQVRRPAPELRKWLIPIVLDVAYFTTLHRLLLRGDGSFPGFAIYSAIQELSLMRETW